MAAKFGISTKLGNGLWLHTRVGKDEATGLLLIVILPFILIGYAIWWLIKNIITHWQLYTLASICLILLASLSFIAYKYIKRKLVIKHAIQYYELINSGKGSGSSSKIVYNKLKSISLPNSKDYRKHPTLEHLIIEINQWKTTLPYFIECYKADKARNMESTVRHWQRAIEIAQKKKITDDEIIRTSKFEGVADHKYKIDFVNSNIAIFKPVAAIEHKNKVKEHKAELRKQRNIKKSTTLVYNAFGLERGKYYNELFNIILFLLQDDFNCEKIDEKGKNWIEVRQEQLLIMQIRSDGRSISCILFDEKENVLSRHRLSSYSEWYAQCYRNIDI